MGLALSAPSGRFGGIRGNVTPQGPTDERVKTLTPVCFCGGSLHTRALRLADIHVARRRHECRGKLDERLFPTDQQRPRASRDRLSSWRLARSCGLGLVLSVAVMATPTEPVLAASVSVRLSRISLASPFSGPCAKANPGFTAGFAQETSVAVDPTDPRHILVGWIQDGRASDVVMASRDGGRSFSRILVPGLSACTGGAFQVASDPGVAFSGDGRLSYFTAIVVNFPSTTSMFASRSLDDGFSWSVPSVIQPPTGAFWDLPVLTPHPRRPNTAFYVYDLRRPPDYISGYSLLSTTTNGGRTWSVPRKLYDPHTSGSWPGISKILVNRDGSLLDVFALVAPKTASGTPGDAADSLSAAAPWFRDDTTQELAIRSVDGGRKWGKPVIIGHSSGRQVNDPATHDVLNTYDTYPSQTVAPNGDVYFSWLEPGATNESSRITVARSTDGGRHWTRRRLTVRGQAALPSIAVAGDGTLGVVYYVIAPASHRGYWPARVRVAISRDRGRQWSTRRVAGPFNLLTTGSKARVCCFLGDYLGVAGQPHGLVAAIPMGRPIAQNRVDVYFTRITTSS